MHGERDAMSAFIYGQRDDCSTANIMSSYVVVMAAYSSCPDLSSCCTFAVGRHLPANGRRANPVVLSRSIGKTKSASSRQKYSQFK